MRRIFILIIIVYVLVFIVGLLIIAEKLLRKVKVEHHYVFSYYHEGSQRGYVLKDSKGNVVYSAERKENEGNFAIYEFRNHAKKVPISKKHRLSGLGFNSQAPNFTKKSFLFDDVDVWDYLKKHGISVQTTIVDNQLTQYKFSKGANTIAFSRKKTAGEYSLRTYEKKLELLFISLFAIARTEK